MNMKRISLTLYAAAVLILADWGVVTAQTPSTVAPPKDLSFAFPGESVTRAVTGEQWVHFVKKCTRLKKLEGLRQLGYYYLDSKSSDTVGEGIKSANALLLEYRRSLARMKPDDPGRPEAKSTIRDLQAKIKRLKQTQSNLTPRKRFINRYFARAKLHVNLLIQWTASDATLDQIKTKAVAFHDNAYTHYQVADSKKLKLGDEGRYDVIALVSPQTGKVMDRCHWAYFRIGHYWVQVITVSDSPKPRGDLMALLRLTANLLGQTPLFEVKAPKEGIAAHPKNVTDLKLTARGPDGQPLANKDLTIRLLEPVSPLTGGALKGAGADGNLRLHSDDKGMAAFTYVPPDIDRRVLPKFMDVERGKRQTILQYMSVKSDSESGVVEIPLLWPFPRVVSFGTGSGVDAGYWGKHPAKLVVADPDSETFTYQVTAVGQLRLAEKLSQISKTHATWTGNNTLQFLYCPPKMGLDLSNLPDLRREMLVANLKFAAEYIDSVTAAPGIKQWVSQTGKTAIDISKNTIGAAKTTYSYAKYTDGILNDNGPVDSKKMGTFIKDTTALLNDVVSTAESVLPGSGKMNVTVELGKWALANLNAIEGVHNQNWKIATSYDDIVFLPIHVEITDPEGHTTVILRKIGVKFPKAQ